MNTITFYTENAGEKYIYALQFITSVAIASLRLDQIATKNNFLVVLTKEKKD
jgi:hypothetical protein